MENINRALVLAPHPDDGEFGCGGTLRKLALAGVSLHYAVFSACKKSVPTDLPDDILFTELEKAAGILGIPAENLHKTDYPVRELPAYRQEILEKLVQIRQAIQPDLVFIPNSHDVHQDHQTLHQEGIRAFKHTRILGYELPWNNITATHNFHVRLEKEHIDAKIAAVNAYASQSFRNYKDEDFLFGLAKVRGVQVNTEYAEAFECIRWIL